MPDMNKHNRRSGNGTYKCGGGNNTEKFDGGFFMGGRGKMPKHRTKKRSDSGSSTMPMGHARIRPTKPGAK